MYNAVRLPSSIIILMALFGLLDRWRNHVSKQAAQQLSMKVTATLCKLQAGQTQARVSLSPGTHHMQT